MAIQGVFYVFALVSNLERSKKYYGETLGWKLGTDEKEVAGFAFGNGYLVLHGDASQAKNSIDRMHVAVLVDDIDAEHARLKKLGVAVGELRNQPWGQRDFEFRDPDNYLWVYGQATRS
jgi:catechol 2,3-dioxygenase-like lactoylglutathione lyase family enzyme